MEDEALARYQHLPRGNLRPAKVRRGSRSFVEGRGARTLPLRLFTPLHRTFTLPQGATRLTPYASRLTPHALRFTPYALRFTFQQRLRSHRKGTQDTKRFAEEQEIKHQTPTCTSHLSRITLYASLLTLYASHLTPYSLLFTPYTLRLTLHVSTATSIAPKRDARHQKIC